MSSLAHFIADLCSTKLLIYHGTLSNNGEDILLFFKCMSEALGGHSLAGSTDKVILIEKRSAYHILDIIPEKCALEQDTFCLILPMRSLLV